MAAVSLQSVYKCLDRAQRLVVMSPKDALEIVRAQFAAMVVLESEEVDVGTARARAISLEGRVSTGAVMDKEITELADRVAASTAGEKEVQAMLCRTGLTYGQRLTLENLLKKKPPVPEAKPIYASENQFTMPGSNSPCTACALSFLDVLKDETSALTSDAVDFMLGQGIAQFEELLDVRRHNASAIGFALESESLAVHEVLHAFPKLKQLGDTRGEHLGRDTAAFFQAKLVLLKESLRENPFIGLVITCHNETIAVAVRKKGEDGV